MSTDYGSLTSFVAPRCRMAPAGLRDELVAMAVEKFPDMPGAGRHEVMLSLRESMKREATRRYGSLLVTFFIGLAINVIARLIVDWWFDRAENRHDMARWKRALART
jgi:hypothetical protein